MWRLCFSVFDQNMHIYQKSFWCSFNTLSRSIIISAHDKCQGLAKILSYYLSIMTMASLRSLYVRWPTCRFWAFVWKKKLLLTPRPFMIVLPWAAKVTAPYRRRRLLPSFANSGSWNLSWNFLLLFETKDAWVRSKKMKGARLLWENSNSYSWINEILRISMILIFIYSYWQKFQ